MPSNTFILSCIRDDTGYTLKIQEITDSFGRILDTDLIIRINIKRLKYVVFRLMPNKTFEHHDFVDVIFNVYL